MRVLTLLGSPKRNGKTSAVLEVFERSMRSNGDEIERIHIADYHINACVVCYACMSKNDEPGCAQKDDMNSILDKMFMADAIIYATPLYSFDFTAQMKPFVDRHMVLDK